MVAERREGSWHDGRVRSMDPPALRRSEWGQGGEKPRAEMAADVVTQLAASVAPGTRLGTKDELRARCGVSVGTFNETLRLLQTRGVVTVQRGPGGGLFAAEQTPMARLAQSVLALDSAQEDVTEALRIRNALEPLLWQDALWHGSPADMKDLRALLAPMEEAVASEDAVEFVRADWRLHARVADITPSALLRSLYVNLLDLVERHAQGVRPRDGVALGQHMRDRCGLHVELVDALENRDGKAVAHLLAQHDTTRGTDAG